MPWRGPEYTGEFPSLGPQIADWIEANCVVPDGDHRATPYKLTDEMYRFLVCHYRLKPEAKPGTKRDAFRYRTSMLVRPQKWGKGPFSAAILCVEAVGPALFGGWDAHGEPVGRPWATPLIQVTASAEDQTMNVWRSLQPMIEMGPLADVIPDTGLGRINLPGGGQIEPVTSKARTRLGAPITGALQDETGTWTKANGGQLLADTQRRGLAGMGGRALQTTNGWDPTEASVAQQLAESTLPDVFVDHIQAPAAWSIRNKVERRKLLKHVYGDSWWVSIESIEAEVLALLEQGEDAQAERFFGNRCKAGSTSWLADGLWDSRKATRAIPSEGTRVCLGFDGSERDDWTVIRAETMDGHSFTPAYGPDRLPTIWDPRQFGGRIPRGEVHAAVDELHRRYSVQRMYCDTWGWQSEVEDWALKHGERRVIEWPTNRIKQMHECLDRFVVDLPTITQDGCRTTNAHVNNARKVARPGDRYILGKASQTAKIDAAMATVLAHEARADALAAGLGRDRRKRVLVL